MLFHRDDLVLLAGITCDGVLGTFQTSIGATTAQLNCAHLVGHVGLGIGEPLQVLVGLVL